MILPSGRTYGFGYDANGNRTSITMPSGAVHTIGLNKVNLDNVYVPPNNPAYATGYNLDREWVDYITTRLFWYYIDSHYYTSSRFYYFAFTSSDPSDYTLSVDISTSYTQMRASNTGQTLGCGGVYSDLYFYVTARSDVETKYYHFNEISYDEYTSIVTGLGRTPNGNGNFRIGYVSIDLGVPGGSASIYSAWSRYGEGLDYPVLSEYANSKGATNPVVAYDPPPPPPSPSPDNTAANSMGNSCNRGKINSSANYGSGDYFVVPEIAATY